MRTDKRLFIALVAAFCLLSVTAASALSAVWKHHGVNLTKHVEIGMSGAEVFQTGNGANSMSCEVFATITTTGGSTGTVTKWEVKNCSNGTGNLLGCQVSTTEAKGLPWTLHVNATDLSVTNVRLRRVFKAGCAISELDKTVTLTLTPDKLSTITGFEFHGATGDYTAFGSFAIKSPNIGTYGIG